jgi:hypothetical protein
VVVMVSQGVIFYSNRGVKSKWWHFLTVPLAGMIMIFILIRAAVTTLLNKGIYWRGSFYSLDELIKGGN